MGEPKKNLLIKTSQEVIRTFKETGVEFFNYKEKIFLFSYKNFLINILLNLEIDFEKNQMPILKPSEEFLDFYKKKGTSINKKKIGTIKDSISFSLEEDYYNLYINLMHTHYINNCKNQPNYSVSIFFDELVQYSLKYKKMKVLV